jgi:hypothetical protein
MYGFFIAFENQFNMIKSIIKSSNDLVLLLKDNTEIDDLIFLTTFKIFLFMSRMIKSVPEILISDYTNNTLKHEISDSFNKVLHKWEIFRKNPKEFIESWEEFIFWWDEYIRIMEKIGKSDNSIYLYMN